MVLLFLSFGLSLVFAINRDVKFLHLDQMDHDEGCPTYVLSEYYPDAQMDHWVEPDIWTARLRYFAQATSQLKDPLSSRMLSIVKALEAWTRLNDEINHQLDYPPNVRSMESTLVEDTINVERRLRKLILQTIDLITSSTTITENPIEATIHAELLDSLCYDSVLGQFTANSLQTRSWVRKIKQFYTPKKKTSSPP